MVATLEIPAQEEGRYFAVGALQPDRGLIDRVGLEFCRANDLLPLAFDDSDRLIIATPLPSTAHAIRLVAQRIRRPVTLRASTRGEVQNALATASGEEPRSEDLRAIVADILVPLELIDRRLAHAWALAATDEAYLGADLVGAGALTDAERIEAIGLAFHLPSIDVVAHPPTAGLDAQVVETVGLPPGVIPLWAVDRELFLGCREPLSGLLLLRLQEALGMHIRPVLTLRPERRGVDRLRTSDLADAGGVGAVSAPPTSRFAGLLAAAGFGPEHGLRDEARADAMALREGLPRVRELTRFRDAAARRLREDTTALNAIPLLRDQGLLTAVTDAADFETVTRGSLPMQVAIAEAAGMDALRETWEALGDAARNDETIAVGRELQLRHGVTRFEVLDLLATVGEGTVPLDRAVARLGKVAPSEMCAAFAAACHTICVTLHRNELDASTTDPIATALGLEFHDPVDHDLARLLTIEQSDALGALPYGRAHGALLVAAADPLSPSLVAGLEALLSEHIEVRPAWRLEIAEAARRAHGRASVGELLLVHHRISAEQLHRALLVVERANVSVAEALRSIGAASETEIAQAVAERSGLPFFSLEAVTLSRETANLLPEALGRSGQMLPISVDASGEVTVAVADPENLEAIESARGALDARVRFVVTTRSDIRDALERLYHRLYVDIAATRLRIMAPENSADRVLTRAQQLILGGSALAFVVLATLWTVPTITVAMTFTTAFYLTFAGYKFFLIFRSLSHELAVPVTDEDVAALDDRDLPVYTILVPLYREAAVLPLLIRSLGRLEYPKEKLDVKLLLEEDDAETIAAARASELPSYFDITVVPNGQPKGKPKACNYGLLHARGEYVVIFDAEDVPDPDQLKRVLVAFDRSPEDVVCIQAKLSYYNRNQNILTRWFTAEYALWFDLLLPGLDASGAPIPLGGTSNHFRTESLLAAGAWDPYNVTEDADLGLRIFKSGGRTAVVDSTTYEEANSVLDNWVRQRSRWVKGYIQTYLVHMRNPVALWRALGGAGFLSFQLMVGGTAFSFLYNPILWLVTAMWFVTRWEFIHQVFPPAIYYVGAIALFAGNFAFAYANVVGCLRRRYYPLVGWALLSPVYWLLMSIAAWKGFLQLFYRPFYWEKTVHGLATPGSLEELDRLAGRRAERIP